MVIKLYISGISASKEVKKRQLRARFLLDSYKIKYDIVDITDPTMTDERDKMLSEAKKGEDASAPQPPQFFNEDDYCGDYNDLEAANDNDELLKFLKLEEDITIENGNASEGEYDLFKPPEQQEADEDMTANGKEEQVDKEKDEDEDVETDVREQITVNGVVYTIPPDRKINVGGRIIDVDELLADEGDEIDLDQVDERLKEGFVSKPTDEED